MSNKILNFKPQQYFPFRIPFMRYILLNASFEVKIKLSQTCKYFYSEFPEIKVINHLKIRKYMDSDIINPKVTCQAVKELIEFSPKIWLKESLEIGYHPTISISPIIYRCTAKRLKIFAKLTIKDFKILTKSQMVKDLFVSEIIGTNGKLISVENIIIDCVPNAHKIYIRFANVIFDPIKQTKNRSQKIIKSLSLKRVIDEFDVSLFNEFLKNNVAPNASITVDFAGDRDKIKFNRFFAKFKSFLETWEPKSLAPIIETRENIID